ncbi:MAG: hypothetical protein Tp138OMZ00d2C19078261_43 [Prokaryotic dsDNA virus sp.]|jgi:hypothetical protein|nr:MAG: hypothetical protein Tp138OMZ00d2C19078261_43 [Prokaryotic dsDNA virus sp.]|tara:strand:- start:30040 stop:30657 length:618 start_codon:yes stop_codon:yes gene_type:complete
MSGTFVAQEGGDHYQAEYQHWDWVIDLNLHYLPATATKYVARWRKKNGIQDLRKAVTYIEKWEKAGLPSNSRSHQYIQNSYPLTMAFNASAKLDDLEADFMFAVVLVAVSNAKGELDEVKAILQKLLALAETAQSATQGQAPAGGGNPTGAATSAPQAAHLGAAGGVAGQGAATSAATGSIPVLDMHPRPDNTGQKHPFGYNEED